MSFKEAHPFCLVVASRVKAKMSDFPSKTVATSKNSPVEDHSSSYSNTQKEQGKITLTFPATKRKLCQRSSVGVVLDEYRDVQLRCDGAFQIDIMPTEGWCTTNHAVCIDQCRYSDAEASQAIRTP